MSHYTVLIAGDNPEEQLERFSEHLETEKHEVDEVSEHDKKEFLDYYIKKDFKNELISFETLYKENGEDWNSNSWEKDENGVWKEYSTYNPDSKWDWYLLGGRWSGMIKLKQGSKGEKGQPGVFKNQVGIDQAKKKDIANLDEIRTFAYLIKGEWYERGQMLMFGVSANDKPEDSWEEEQKALIDSIGDNDLISIYDLHI